MPSPSRGKAKSVRPCMQRPRASMSRARGPSEVFHALARLGDADVTQTDRHICPDFTYLCPDARGRPDGAKSAEGFRPVCPVSCACVCPIMPSPRLRSLQAAPPPGHRRDLHQTQRSPTPLTFSCIAFFNLRPDDDDDNFVIDPIIGSSPCCLGRNRKKKFPF